MFFLLATIDCPSAVEKIQKNYSELLLLPVDAIIIGKFYARDVITFNEKIEIDDITANHGKIIYVLDKVVIPSLLQGMTEKYSAFIDVLKTRENSVFSSMAEKIGMMFLRWKLPIKPTNTVKIFEYVFLEYVFLRILIHCLLYCMYPGKMAVHSKENYAKK